MDPAQVTDVESDLLASPARRAIIDALHQHAPGPDEVDVGGLTAQHLAARLGLHVTTVRFHTDRLEAAGLVESHLTRAFGVGRPRKVYGLPRPATPPDRSTYLLRLLEAMTESFSSDVTPKLAGERWARHHLPVRQAPPATSPGAWLGKVGLLVDVLQEWGYTPELTTADGGRTCHLALTSCPFRELASAHPDVVCGIHRGLLLGALRQMGEHEVDVTLEPFVTPARCDAHLTTRHPFEQPPPTATRGVAG